MDICELKMGRTYEMIKIKLNDFMFDIVKHYRYPFRMNGENLYLRIVQGYKRESRT